MTPNRNPRIYLDQNILTYIRDGKIGFTAADNLDWIYSDEHFREIARGHDLSFLNVLRALKAQQIRLSTLDGATNQATIDFYSCPIERYKMHLEAVNEVPFDDSLFLEFIARMFGANNFDNVISLLREMPVQFEKLLANTGAEGQQLLTALRRTGSVLEGLIEEKLSETLPLDKTRTAFGTGGGRVAHLNSENPIRDIWDIVKGKVPGLSIDQFFGIEDCVGGGSAPRSTYYAIIGCNLILNLVGYRSDVRLSGSERLAASQSDGSHIAYAAFCDGFVSGDNRLCDRAKAIYLHLKITTAVMQLTRRQQPDASVSAVA